MDVRALSQMELATQPFPPVQYDFRIFIDESAFDRICNSADDSREVGGILVGEVCRDDNGPFVSVDDIIEALHAEESGTELTITHDTWNHIHQQMDTIHAGKRIIGWYHTHPNFGIFLSERDQFIQQSFFNLPFQIALVYDPVRRVHGVFSWRDNKPWRVRQYWIGATPHIWDDPRETSEPSEGKRLAESGSSKTEIDSAVNQTPQTVGGLLGNSWIMGAALMGILLGLALGLNWKRNSGQTAAHAQIAQEAVASINSDLLAVIRDSLTDEAFGRTFDDSIGQLDIATQSLQPLNNDPGAALQSIQKTRDLLNRSRRDRLIAREMLQQIEKVIRINRTPEFISRDLAVQHTFLGDLYVQLARDAAQNGDRPRVSDLLKRATLVNPERQADYEQQIKAFEEQGTLPQSVATEQPK
jgi:proteasome lid subunit RPN8/RPN11